MSTQQTKCPATNYAIFTDTAHTTAFSNTAQVFFSDLNDATLSSIKVYTHVGMSITTVYLQAYTIGKANLPPYSEFVNLGTPGLKINILVCGAETLNLIGDGLADVPN